MRLCRERIPTVMHEEPEYSITWYANLDWPGVAEKEIRAVVTARAPDNPPDYMVVDIDGKGVRYYPAVEFLPGGLFGNPIYRTSSLVLRRIHARNITWKMGKGETTPNKEHSVTLASDYFMGVFEVTQAQYYWMGCFGGSLDEGYKIPSLFKLEGYRAMRPVENIGYANARNNDFPTAPKPTSILGRLRTSTGMDFDLPYEAQWEYACRAGNDNYHWGDGSVYNATANDPNCPSRHKNNGGAINGSTSYSDAIKATCTPEYGTAIVGESGNPNLWGLYDMHGNVAEWCLDRYWKDLTEHDADGDGIPDKASTGDRVCRGGYWTRGSNEYAMSFARNSVAASTASATIGMRVAYTLAADASTASNSYTSDAVTVSTDCRADAGEGSALDSRFCTSDWATGALNGYQDGLILLFR